MNQECGRCGREYYQALVKAWPNTNSPIMKLKLPEYPDRHNVTITLDSIKEFNAQLAELGEFAAWVCGVPIETLCRLDMVKYAESKSQGAGSASR